MLAVMARKEVLLEHLQDRAHRLAPDLAALGRVEAEPLDDIGRGAAAGAEFDPAVAEHIEGGDPLGDVERVVARDQDHGETESEGSGALADRGQHHLGRRAMPDLVIKVLLGDPEILEAGRLARNALLERIPICATLGRLGPGARNLNLRHQSEFHETFSRSDWRDDLGRKRGDIERVMPTVLRKNFGAARLRSQAAIRSSIITLQACHTFV